MSSETPSYFNLADELAGKIITEAGAWAASQLSHRPDLAPAPGMPVAVPTDELPTFHLNRVRLAGQVMRELRWRLDPLADEARNARAPEAEVADAWADRSPAELRTDREGPIDA
jgi:hypothetical protein